MRFPLITIFLGVLASNVIAGPIANPSESILDSRARPAAATEGKPCSGFIEGSPISGGTCTPFGDCGVNGKISNEFVRFKSADC